MLLDDGPSNVLFALLGELRSTQIENIVIGLRQSPDNRNPRHLIESTGNRYVELTMSGAFLDFTVILPLVRTLLQEQPDVIQCNLIRASLYGRLAARLTGNRPVISIVHNVERYMVSKSVGSRLARMAECWTKRFVSAYVAVSKAVAHAQAEVLGTQPETIEVIYNGLADVQKPISRTESRRHLGISENAFVCGSIGRLHVQKNYERLLRAIAIAAPFIPELHVVLVGDGPDLSHLGEISRQLGISSAVHLTGRRSDVSDLLYGFDIFLMTSDYEGMPVALLESMRAGLPSIVTDVGGMPEAVLSGTTGIVERTGEPDAIAKCIAKLSGDTKLRLKMGSAARARYREQFSAARMATGYLNLYKRLGVG